MRLAALASLYITSASAAVNVSHFDKITADTPSRLMHEHLTLVSSSDGSVVNAKKIDLQNGAGASSVLSTLSIKTWHGIGFFFVFFLVALLAFLAGLAVVASLGLIMRHCK